MAVSLVIEPGRVVTWEEFVRFPSFSIALDGFCAGLTKASLGGLRLNINHHEESLVGRLAMRSTSDQSLILVKMGLFDEYQIDGKPEATLYANDCDQDVVLATYVLMYPEVADKKAFREIVRMEDYLDTSGGLFPVTRRSHVVRRMAWIFEPFDRVRQSGKLFKMTGDEMRGLIDVMHSRVATTMNGRGKEISLDMRYDVMRDFGMWQMVNQTGLHARLGMSADGVKAFVAVLNTGNGPHRYVVGRLSNFIPFPVTQIYDRLNGLEGIGADNPDRWGGTDTIGGSPRDRGSRFSPDEIATIVNDLVAEVRARRLNSLGTP